MARAAAVASGESIAEPDSTRPGRRRPVLIAVGVAAVVALGVYGISTRTGPPSPTPPATGARPTVPGTDVAPSTTVEIGPVSSLPPATDLSEVPITVPADSPLQYWRFLPDLDVSERQTSAGSTELCWRTPAGQGCIDDAFNSPAVGIVPTADGAIVLVRPALVPISPVPTDPMAPRFQPGPDPTTVTATLSDGSIVTAAVHGNDGIGIRYARVPLPPDVSVVTASSGE